MVAYTIWCLAWYVLIKFVHLRYSNNSFGRNLGSEITWAKLQFIIISCRALTIAMIVLVINNPRIDKWELKGKVGGDKEENSVANWVLGKNDEERDMYLDKGERA